MEAVRGETVDRPPPTVYGYGMDLRYATPAAWADIAFEQFDRFLLDHALCERKASTVGMSFVARYPDRSALLEPMINYAREELEHFHQVFKVIQKRGLRLPPDEENPYVSRLMARVRTGRDERFLDRLLVAGLMEARGAERLQMMARRLTDPDLKHLYERLTTAEFHHRDLFIEMARLYFSESILNPRLDYWLNEEAAALAAVPLRPALH